MKKYKVTKEFINELETWRNQHGGGVFYISGRLFEELPNAVHNWRFSHSSILETNKRLAAIINWVDGEDVFEIGTPKYIVQRKDFNFLVGSEYLSIDNYTAIHITRSKDKATIFDDFKKASEWANAHFEVVEVDE